MDINRAWMYDMYENRQIKPTFLKGVDDFLNFATSQAHFMDGEKIKCPCTKCRNCKFLLKDDVEDHLYRHGFFPDYYWWTAHGEPFVPVEPSVPSLNREQISRDNRRGSYEHLTAEERMVFDIAGPSFFPPTGFRHNADSIPTDGIHYQGMETPDSVNEVNEDMMTNAVPTDEEARWSERFYNVLKAADEPVYPGCNTHTQLSFVSRLLSLKSEHNMSESLFNGFLQLYDEVLPSGHKIPRDYYQTKKVFESLELPVEKIHMCPNGCMLYWKENADAESCKFCGHDRYERKGSQKSRIPHQVLRYFPLTPRLQRLYAAEATAHAMTWHARCVPDEGVMSHPSHGDAWKRLDATYPNFASKPRNVRLGLCTDGFAPFSTSGRTYSCWPVIVTPYNLPPDMCMKRQYLFLSMIVPGPRNLLGDPLGSVDSIDEENNVEPAESDDEESSSNTSEDIEMIYSEEE